MISYSARVVSANLKDNADFIRWLTDDKNSPDVKVISVDSEYFTCAVESGAFDRMMKHFDIEWVTEAERSKFENDLIKRFMANQKPQPEITQETGRSKRGCHSQDGR